MSATDVNEKLDLPQETFEPVVSRPVELDLLGTELSICFQGTGGTYEIRTCYGDIKSIVDALMDYARLLGMVCEQWELTAYHKAVYELHADKLRSIAKKYQAGIGYDYEAALEACRKKAEKRQAESDTGGEALEMGYRVAEQRRKAKEKEKRADFDKKMEGTGKKLGLP